MFVHCLGFIPGGCLGYAVFACLGGWLGFVFLWGEVSPYAGAPLGGLRLPSLRSSSQRPFSTAVGLSSADG